MLDMDRVTSSDEIIADLMQDSNIRPKKLSDYIGQNKVKDQLKIFIQAAQKRNESMDHTLIFGPPGLGKTTLANIIANEMNVNVKTTSGPVLEKAGDLAGILTNLEANDVLFIDEIHRLSPVIEEILYPAMEDFQIDIIIGEGSSSRAIKLDLPQFTLVGATTRAGLLTSPLRDRFGIIQRLEYYHPSDLEKIITRSGKMYDYNIEYESSLEIAKRSRGTPRIANRLLKRVRDYTQVNNNGISTLDTTKNALRLLDVDIYGLDNIDRKLLSIIIDTFDGGPVGIDSISASLSENRGTIEEVIEPFLIQTGLLLRTPRGRIATSKAYDHFNQIPPKRLLEVFNES